MIPVLAVALLPASYFGVTAALDHMNGGRLTSCVSSGCGSAAMSPEGATTSAPAAATQAAHARTPSPARHTPAAHPSAAASHRGRDTPPAPPSASSSRPSPRASEPRPAKRASPPPAPPQRPRAVVSWQPEQRWLGGFTGQFTMANDGQRTIGSWQLTVTLPGDQVRDVQGADWYTTGDTLIMQPLHGSGPLEPGSSLTISIVAYGNDDSPATCSVNGHTCHS